MEGIYSRFGSWVVKCVRSWWKLRLAYSKLDFIMTGIAALFLTPICLLLLVGFVQFIDGDTTMEAVAWSLSVFGIVLVICLTTLLAKKLDNTTKMHQSDNELKDKQENIYLRQALNEVEKIQAETKRLEVEERLLDKKSQQASSRNE